MDSRQTAKNLYLQRGIECLIVCGLYIAAAYVGQQFAIAPGNVTPFWPAAGIILAAVICRGYWIWPGIWLGACIGNGWAYADFSSFNSTWQTLIAANLNGLGDTLCALLGAYFIQRRLDSNLIFHRIEGVTVFVLFGAALGSIVSATLGVVGLCLGGFLAWDDFFFTWITWAVGDGVGILVVTPLILVFTSRSAFYSRYFRKLLELENIAFLLIVLTVTYAGMAWSINASMPKYWLLYFVFLALLIGCFRYGIKISVFLVSGISLLAILVTSQGVGLFTGTSLNQSLLHLQSFVGIATVTTLLINAVLLERGQALRALEKANVDLERANSELESFSYSLSHDLRAPVRTVTSFSQILLEDSSQKLDEEDQRHLTRLVRAGKHMAEVIDDVVSLSVLSTKQVKHEKINLSQLAHELVQQLLEQNLENRTTIDIQPNVIGYGDRGLLRLAIKNLLENSLKYTKDSQEPHVEFGTIQRDTDQWFYIRDNGAGFDMQYASKLFLPFQRLHKSEDYDGTGIGLATVKRVIDRHGGQVFAESTVDKGACFYFSLPHQRIKA